MKKLILNGVEYDNIPKLIEAVPVWPYIELQDQTGISSDEVDTGKRADGTPMPWRTMLACYAFLIRRGNGEEITFRQAAEQLVPKDSLVLDDLEDDPEGPPDPTQSGSSSSESETSEPT